MFLSGESDFDSPMELPPADDEAYAESEALFRRVERHYSADNPFPGPSTVSVPVPIRVAAAGTTGSAI